MNLNSIISETVLWPIILISSFVSFVRIQYKCTSVQHPLIYTSIYPSIYPNIYPASQLTNPTASRQAYKPIRKPVSPTVIQPLRKFGGLASL